MLAVCRILLVCRVLLVIACTFPVLVWAHSPVDVSAYLGLDAQWRHLSPKKGAGDNILKKHYQQSATHIGLRLNDLFGLELGYQKTGSANRHMVPPDGAFNYFSDTADPDPNNYISYSKASIKGPYAHVLALWPISEEYRLKLIAAVGVARLRASLESRMDLMSAVTGQLLNPAELLFNFSKTAWVPKLSLGAEHLMNDQWGIRTLLGWEGTAKLSGIRGWNANLNQRSNAFVASLKNSTTAGVGIFYKFF